MIFSTEPVVKNNCTEDYVGDTARRIVVRAKDHNGRDQLSI